MSSSTACKGSENIVAAERILSEIPLIDGHNDFPWMLRGWHKNRLSSPDVDITKMPIGQTDLARLAKGRLGGQFWSAFVPCPARSNDGGQSDDLEILRASIQQIDTIHLMIERYPSHLGMVTRSDNIIDVFRSGRIASLIGIEGLHQIGNSASVLRMYHRVGVRYITLCHNSSNLYADSATCPRQPHGGLSEAGRAILREMNRIGMMIDLSHTSEDTQTQALAVSSAPVIFSHSSCYTLRPNPRNVSDTVLDKVRGNGGIIMICFSPSMISVPGTPATVQQIADHITYAGDRIGYEHVGIGSDFDGMLEGPEDLDDVSCFPKLVAELLGRDMPIEKLKMVLGLNLVRVMADVEEVARKEKLDSRSPLWDEIEDIWTAEQREMLVSKGVERQNLEGKS